MRVRFWLFLVALSAGALLGAACSSFETASTAAADASTDGGPRAASSAIDTGTPEASSTAATTYVFTFEDASAPGCGAGWSAPANVSADLFDTGGAHGRVCKVCKVSGDGFAGISHADIPVDGGAWRVAALVQRVDHGKPEAILDLNAVLDGGPTTLARAGPIPLETDEWFPLSSGMNKPESEKALQIVVTLDSTTCILLDDVVLAPN